MADEPKTTTENESPSFLRRLHNFLTPENLLPAAASLIPGVTSYQELKNGNYVSAVAWGALDIAGLASMIIPPLGAGVETAIAAAKLGRVAGTVAKGFKEATVVRNLTKGEIANISKVSEKLAAEGASKRAAAKSGIQQQAQQLHGFDPTKLMPGTPEYAAHMATLDPVTQKAFAKAAVAKTFYAAPEAANVQQGIMRGISNAWKKSGFWGRAGIAAGTLGGGILVTDLIFGKSPADIVSGIRNISVKKDADNAEYRAKGMPVFDRRAVVNHQQDLAPSAQTSAPPAKIDEQQQIDSDIKRESEILKKARERVQEKAREGVQGKRSENEDQNGQRFALDDITQGGRQPARDGSRKLAVELAATSPDHPPSPASKTTVEGKIGTSKTASAVYTIAG